MKPTLVTGANGHLGNNLCRELSRRGERVRAMIRPSADPAAIADLGVEIVRGDVLDPESVARAVEGCGRVYHSAAVLLMWSKHPERDIVRPNVEGARNVLEAAARAGVEKVVHVSTTGTMGWAKSPAESRNEDHFQTDPHSWYMKAKIAGEKGVFEVRRRTGLPVAVVNPGLILGPRFFKPSESVRQVLDFLNEGAPVYFDNGFSMVDVDDVVRGTISAMEKGRDGERYILAGENLTLKRSFDMMAELTGLPAPKVRLPVPVLRVAATLTELGSKLTGSVPRLDRLNVDEFAGKYAYFDNSKAVRELGYTWLSARDTLRRTIAWAIERGFVTEKRRMLLKPHRELQGVAY